MHHTLIFLIVISLCLGTALPVMADKGGVPNANAGSSTAGGNGNAGNSGNSTDAGANGSSGNPNANTNRNSGVTLPLTDGDASTVLPAVVLRQALSLAEIRQAIRAISHGRLLDITLLRVNGQLVYDVTVSEGNNVVRHVYLDARSGRQLRAPS